MESTLCSCLASLLQVQPRPFGEVPLPHRARACPVLPGSCCVSRAWVHEANAMHEEPGKNVPFRVHPTTPHCTCRLQLLQHRPVGTCHTQANP